MTILRLISQLQQLKDLHGNMLVESRNPAGEFDEVCDVQIVNTSEKHKVVNYRVYLDT
mgnify:CR=1 FL=1